MIRFVSKTGKVWDQKAIQELLDWNDRAVCNALARLHDRQTMDERSAGVSIHENAMGFNATDAEFFSSLAQQFKEKGWLSRKQIAAARRAGIDKYWRQLLEVIEANERGAVGKA